MVKISDKIILVTDEMGSVIIFIKIRIYNYPHENSALTSNGPLKYYSDHLNSINMCILSYDK